VTETKRKKRRREMRRETKQAERDREKEISQGWVRLKEEEEGRKG